MTIWQAIIFDLDDTLYPEREYALSGFWAVAVWAATYVGCPVEQGFAELQRLFEQGVRGDIFNRWLAAHGVASGRLVPHMVRVYREHKPALTPFPGIVDLLAALREHCRLGLVGDGYLAVQQNKLAALGLADYFEAVVFSDAYGREAWKPSTKPFRAVLDQLRAEAARSVYVADNPSKDFFGARQVGMYTVRLRQVGGEYAHLAPPSAQHAPDITVTSVAELEPLLAPVQEERLYDQVSAP